MFRSHVNELTPGDQIYVENHWGEFEIHRVIVADRFHITLTKQRFMRKSGWEVSYRLSRKDLTSGKRNRHRIHWGDGKLFTPEQVAHYARYQIEEAKRTELIYSAIRTSPVLWRNLSTKQLETIHDWLTHTQGQTNNE